MVNWRADGLRLWKLSLIRLLNHEELATLTRPFDRWMQEFTACVLGSLGLETYCASIFNKAIKGHTTGVHGVWFATKGEPQFAHIVRCTTLCNIPFYGFLIAFLGACFGLW